MLKHSIPANNGPGNVSVQSLRQPRNLNRSTQPLNASMLSTHGPGPPNMSKMMNGGPPRMHFYPTPLPSLSSHSNLAYNKERSDAREALTSLGLLCLVSLLLALLSLIFLLKISPGGRELPPPPLFPTAPEDYAIVYDVTLALCALSLSLNLCCLLVCAIQFLFAVKLVRAPPVITSRGNKYLKKSSLSRVCAVGGFFMSIPIFLTGIILYTFCNFHSIPAIVSSATIGVGILFSGWAVVSNVFLWQREKTISVRQMNMPMNISAISPPTPFMNGGTHLSFNTTANANTTIGSTTTTAANHNNHAPINSTMNHMNGVPHLGVRTTPVTQLTPMSGNHSHISFNHSAYLPYGIRTATATPPTPKVGGPPLPNRDVSGSVSPGMGGQAPNIDMNSVTATNSPLELSTLV